MLKKLRNFITAQQEPTQEVPVAVTEPESNDLTPYVDPLPEEPAIENTIETIEELPFEDSIETTEEAPIILEPPVVPEAVLEGAELEIPIQDLDEQEPISEEDDVAYIYHSTEVIGYANREQQVANYRLIYDIIGDASVLDFGCGRGDFNVFYSQYLERPMDEIDYAGIDLNGVLINAGKELYPNLDLRHMDWFSVTDDLRKDWCINANSLNLRYDQILMSDWDYFTASINAMYNNANVGIVVLLNSSLVYDDEGLLTWSPGDVLNWAQTTYGNVVIDHSFIDSAFTLIIYK